MSLPFPRHRHSFEQYLELEEISWVRHEYYAGEIYAMAGGTPEHAAIAANITARLGAQLASTPCCVYGLATYPDVTVVCGPSERDPQSATHIVNPKVVIEVPSESTADYDRGEKLQHYQQIPSLAAAVLVDHAAPRVELWTRQGAAWRCQTFGSGEVVPLVAISCVLAVDQVYLAAREA
jgi:Uma2 family endonuclease